MWWGMWTPSALASEATTISAEAWRVVEAQHEIATRRLTDSDREQILLEDILEASKPDYPAGCARLHYLLKTPFRYQPTQYGSRFRRRFSPFGVFYAAEVLTAALAEVAFHRLRFFTAMAMPVFPARAVPLTAFSVRVRAELGVDLTRPPLVRDAALWLSAADYSATQALADAAHEAHIEAIRYASVRDPQHRACIALLNPRAFRSRRPQRNQTWFVQVRHEEVVFWRDRDDRCVFARGLFEVDGALPDPH